MSDALTLCMLGNVVCFSSSADFLKIKILSRVTSECQRVWIQIKSDMSNLFAKYQQTTMAASKELTNHSIEPDYLSKFAYTGK